MNNTLDIPFEKLHFLQFELQLFTYLIFFAFVSQIPLE